MKKRFSTLVFLFTVLISLTANEFSVYVIDRDLELPLEGVRIHFADDDLLVYSDENGSAILNPTESHFQHVLIAELIGYEPRKILVKNLDEPLLIEMLMEGVLEGQELIVEEEAIGITDEEIGVSMVLEKEFIQSAAKIGVIEDVMSAIKILPGVIYSGGFGSGMSVRGGAVDGITTVLDGFTVKAPYHWGGAYSIFNPNIVESVKFSPGIFSAKYGQATSALMEVNTVKPNEGFKFEGILSTSTLELFTQIPFGKNNEFGIFGGFRLTNYDLILGAMNWLADTADLEDLKATIAPVTRPPYIYDFYLKAFYRPSDKFEWYINGFFGNDGIGISTQTDPVEDSIVSDVTFDYFNTDFFISTNVKLLATDNLIFQFLTGYEHWIQEMDANMTESGIKLYSSGFINEFGSLYPLITGDPLIPDSYSVETDSSFSNNIINSGVQGKLDLDWFISDRVLMQSGIGSTLDITSLENLGDFWSVDVEGALPTYTQKSFDLDINETKSLNTYGYFNFNMKLVPDVLKMDLGFRLDHSYFMGEEDFTLNTYPVPSPRINLTFSPGNEGRFFNNNSFSIGAGLFSKTPFDSIVLNKDFGIDDFELSPPKSLMTVLGWDTHLPQDFHFKIETYYKYIFDRYYQNLINDGGELLPQLLTDGKGHVFGTDLMLERKTSRYIDGMLSYTFVYARYFNPVGSDDGLSTPSDSEPRGEWFYPLFHRFHSLNLLLDIKPANNFTITTKLSFATGTPKNEWDETKEMYWAAIENSEGSIEMAEMYNRGSHYSDALRMNWILALDLKIAFHNYKADSKIEWEYYIAVENLLAPLMAAILPDDSVDLDKWNGNEKSTPSPGLNFPIPSIGFKMSY